MTPETRIARATGELCALIDACPNCRGTNSIRVLCVAGTREETCHVCRPLRNVLETLTNENSRQG